MSEQNEEQHATKQYIPKCITRTSTKSTPSEATKNTVSTNTTRMSAPTREKING
jgi:hypothetical protein